MAGKPTIPPAFAAKLTALKGKLVLVTGGCGFVGGNIVNLLLEVGANVRVFDKFINQKPWHDKDGKIPSSLDGRLAFQAGDLCDEKDLTIACDGVWAVLHVASPPPTSVDKTVFMTVNVGGTEKLLAACRKAGINRFVFTSSASLVFEGKDQMNYKESDGTPAKGGDDYIHSKLLAEQLVIKANDNDLWTVALRPHAIFGPRDTSFLPRMLIAAKGKKTRYIVGDATNVSDFTYVTNVAYSHLLAACELRRGAAICGQAYFITNRKPISFWSVTTHIFSSLGYEQPWLPLPKGMMTQMAKMLAVVTRYTGARFTFDMQAVKYITKHHFYDTDKALRDFGYKPAVGMTEALERTLLSGGKDALANPNQPMPVPPPKFNTMLMSTMIVGVLAALLYFIVSLVTGIGTIGAILSAIGRVKYVVIAVALFKLWRSVVWVKELLLLNPRPFNEPVPTHLTDRTAVITGGNAGIGFATALRLAKLDCGIVLACRDPTRAQTAVSVLRAAAPENKRISYILLDLASFASVRQFTAECKARNVKVDYLINNAGAMIDARTTEDGYDAQFQTNYLGHFLLTNLLLDGDILARNARIVNLASAMHTYGTIDFSQTDLSRPPSKSVIPIPSVLSKFNQYNVTKLANILFSMELHNRRLTTNDISTVSLHPGTVNSDFINNIIPLWLRKAVLGPFLKTAEEGAGTHGIIYALLDPSIRGVSGVYISDSQLARPSTEARNPLVARDLWDRSCAMCKYTMPESCPADAL